MSQTSPGGIRRAKAEDLHALTDIYNQAIEAGGHTAHTRALSPAERRPWLEAGLGDDTPIFVWEQEGRPVGYAALSRYRPGRAALDGVVELSYYIDFSCHRRGLGAALAVHALDYARARGFTHAVAILLGGNRGSIGLLEHLGFAEWGRLPGVARMADGRRLDHLYYGRAL